MKMKLTWLIVLNWGCQHHQGVQDSVLKGVKNGSRNFLKGKTKSCKRKHVSRKNIKYQRTPQTHTYTQTHTTKDWQFIKKIGSKIKIKISLKISIYLAETSCVTCELLHQFKGLEIWIFQLFSHCLICGIVKWIHCFFFVFHRAYSKRPSKWNDDYYCDGFICTIEKNGIERPQCILYSAIFPNANLKPFLLNLHFKRVHGMTESGNDNETLMVKNAHFDHQETLPKLWFTSTGNWLKRKTTQIITEELVKPFVLEVVKTILGKDMEWLVF